VTRIAALERAAKANVRPYAGKWVAVKNGQVVYSASTSRSVVQWVRKNGEVFVTVFRVRRRREPSTWVY
jgi:hypothetical protein